MRILIAAGYVTGISREGGSGRFMKCLADAMERKGHTVIKSTDPDEYRDETFDLILCSHFMPSAGGRKIFIAHGIIADERMDLGADEYVSVSEEVRRKNLLRGIDSRVIPQPIDIPESAAVPKKLVKILIIRREDVNYDPFTFLSDKYDVEYSNLDVPIEEQIAKADLVISLGRGALEAMAYGKPVLVADNRPYIGAFGDGYVTAENVERFALSNFSGRTFRFAINQKWIESELEKYNPSDGLALRQYVIENHASDKIADEYLLPDYKMVFGVMVNDPLRMRQCIIKSEIPPGVPVVTIEDPDSATAGLNRLLREGDKHEADVMILAHQDMHFPANWMFQVRNQLRTLPDDWVLAGIIGKDFRGNYCGHLHDSRLPLKFATHDIHIFPVRASCFDECCIIVNMKSGFRFEEWMKGFDLYGTLGPLQVEKAGGSCWMLDAFATHHCLRTFWWEPDELFAKNMKELYKRFPDAKVIESTVLGVDVDMQKEALETARNNKRAA